MTDLRKYQQEAYEAALSLKSGSGRIIIPTGGGKTVVEAFTLRDIVNEDVPGGRIHVVLAPRIALVNQLFKEYRAMIGQNFLSVAFHSGRIEEDYTKIYWAETATTSIQQIRHELRRCNEFDHTKDLVIFSTYASAHKLVELEIDTVIADESQYCVAEDTYKVVKAMNAKRKYFFTATEKHTESEVGRGLNNEETFGPVLYQVAPKTLIDGGYIVPPRLHVMHAKAKDENYSIIDEIIHVGKKQMELSKEMPVNKILYAMKGTDDVKSIVEKVDDVRAAFPKHTIFTIVSNNKLGAMVNGEKMARGVFMKRLREADNALIFHYDILSEGIDVDGITGVVLLRHMSHAKTLQTIGRAVRIYKANPAIKKQAWVSVCDINDNGELSDHLKRKISALRDGGFEVNREEVAISEDPIKGIPEEEELEDYVGKEKQSRAGALLDGIMHDIEVDEIRGWVEDEELEETISEGF